MVQNSHTKLTDIFIMVTLENQVTFGVHIIQVSCIQCVHILLLLITVHHVLRH